MVKVFVAGCSYSFGLGVAYSQTWVNRFKYGYASLLRIQRRALNVVNFSECGCSNEAISRRLLSQCSRVRPDLVIAAFTHHDRTEIPLNGQMHKVGPWVLNDIDRVRKHKTHGSSGWWNSISAATLDTLAELASHYFMFYSTNTALLNTLRQMLLVQSYCKSARIPYVMLLTETDVMQSHVAKAVPALGPLRDLVDVSRISRNVNHYALDRAQDLKHPGPLSHQRCADDLCRLLANSS
jgi:hypothetical protein